MKELSIEEKAKRYDEAIIRGSRLWESDMITRENYEYIFPEVKESEDEEIKEMLKVAVERTPWMQDKKEKCYEWLEKQGEQKPADKKGMNLVEEEMTPFQKEVFCIIDTTIEKEQGLKQICDKLFALASKEIKQTLAWSKEDERCLTNAIDACMQMSEEDYNYSQSYIDAINWLKSLKERYTWKPSELQIGYLSQAIFTLGNEGDCATAAELRELRDNLEMLREK